MTTATGTSSNAAPLPGEDARRLDLPALQRDVSTCTLCDLAETRTNVAFGDGDPTSGLVIVGAAPGRSEDLTGRPFSGAVGNLIDNVLLENGLDRSDVYLCTVVKCRPPGERPPRPVEVETCLPHLRAQLSHLAPKAVVALGDLPTRVLLGRALPLDKVAGYRFPLNGATVIPTFDPQVALQGNPHAMAALRRDIRTARAIVEGRIAGAGAGFAELRARLAETAGEAAE